MGTRGVIFQAATKAYHFTSWTLPPTTTLAAETVPASVTLAAESLILASKRLCLISVTPSSVLPPLKPSLGMNLANVFCAWMDEKSKDATDALFQCKLRRSV